MSDDQATATNTPKRGGWPRGVPRKGYVKPHLAEGKKPQPGAKSAAPLHKTKYGLLRDRLREGFEGDNYDSFEFATPHQDRFKIDSGLVDALAREGIALQWHVEKVMGMEQTHSMAAAQKNGWRHIAPDEIPEINMTESDGLVLMARPMSIHKRAIALEKQDALKPLENQRAKHMLDGIPRVTGAREARRSNFHRSEYERLDIPGAERD